MANNAFGADQQAPAVGSFGVGRDHPVRSVAQGDLGIGSLASDLGRIAKAKAKDEAESGLGKDIADANEQMRLINNPVERQLHFERHRNGMIRKYGASFITEIDGGLAKRDIKQRFNPEDGTVENFDAKTGERLGMVSMAGPEDQIMQKEINRVGVFQAEFPTLSQTGDNILGAALKTGSPVQYPDIQRLVDSSNNLVFSMERDIDLLRNMRGTPNITVGAIDEAKNEMRGRLFNNIFSTLRFFQNNTLAGALSNPKTGLTPDVAAAMPRAFISDVLANMQESDAFAALGIDQKEMMELLDKGMQGITQQYKASFDNDNALALRSKAKIDAILNIAKDEDFLALRTNNRPLWDATIAGPGYTAMANILTAVGSMDAQYATLSSSARGQVRSIYKILEREDFNTKNLARMNRLRFTEFDDIVDAKEITKEILGSPTGTLHFDDVQNFWTTNRTRLEALAKQKNISIEPIYKQLEQYGISREKMRQTTGLTPSDDEDTKTILKQLMEMFSPGSKPRPRPAAAPEE